MQHAIRSPAGDSLAANIARPLQDLTSNLVMAARRNRAQAAPVSRRRPSGSLRSVPRSVVAAAEQSVSELRPSLLRYLDLHPALALLTGVAIIALVCVIYLTQVTAVTNANYTLQALQEEHSKLVQEQEDLQLKIGRAQSLSNILSTAEGKLHMVPVGDQYSYITVTNGPLASMPAAPTPALPTESAGNGP